MAAAARRDRGLAERPPGRNERRWPRSARSTTVAYGSPAGVIAAALGEIPAAEIRGYGIRVDGELASVASIIDVDEDAFVTMVATLPHRRGKHLASNAPRPRARTRRGNAARPPPPCRPRSSARASTPASATARSARSTSTRSARSDASTPRSKKPSTARAAGSTATVDYPRSINCPHCGYGAYYNPKPVAAAIPVTTRQRNHPAQERLRPRQGPVDVPRRLRRPRRIG